MEVWHDHETVARPKSKVDSRQRQAEREQQLGPYRPHRQPAVCSPSARRAKAKRPAGEGLLGPQSQAPRPAAATNCRGRPVSGWPRSGPEGRHPRRPAASLGWGKRPDSASRAAPAHGKGCRKQDRGPYQVTGAGKQADGHGCGQPPLRVGGCSDQARPRAYRATLRPQASTASSGAPQTGLDYRAPFCQSHKTPQKAREGARLPHFLRSPPDDWLRGSCRSPHAWEKHSTVGVCFPH
jgi:hypothetical protein